MAQLSCFGEWLTRVSREMKKIGPVLLKQDRPNSFAVKSAAENQPPIEAFARCHQPVFFGR